jgi:hypothetical protein
MLRLISDQNFSGRTLRGIGLRIPDLDLVRALDAGLAKAPDSVLLQWAAVEDRILLTHNVNTIPGFAYDRVRVVLECPGDFWWTPIGPSVRRSINWSSCSNAARLKNGKTGSSSFLCEVLVWTSILFTFRSPTHGGEEAKPGTKGFRGVRIEPGDSRRRGSGDTMLNSVGSSGSGMK